MRATAEALLSPDPEGPGYRLAGHLLEIAAEIGERGQLSPEFRGKLEALRERARRGEARPHSLPALKEVYTALTGEEFTMPVASFDAAVAYSRKQLERSSAALEAGRFDEAERELLRLILAVMTPMPSKHP